MLLLLNLKLKTVSDWAMPSWSNAMPLKHRLIYSRLRKVHFSKVPVCRDEPIAIQDHLDLFGALLSPAFNFGFLDLDSRAKNSFHEARISKQSEAVLYTWPAS